MEDEDVIRSKMEETRTSLTDKVETLESQVMETAQDATSAVMDTVGAVKETVASMKDTIQETVTAVKDKVEESVTGFKEMFDIGKQVDRHPWLMVGGSIAVGYFLEGVLGGNAAHAAESPLAAGTGQSPAKSQHGPNGKDNRRGQTPKAPPSDLWNMLAPEIGHLKGLALGALMGTVRDMVVQALPEQVGKSVKDIIDSATKKLGGAPTDLPGTSEPAGSRPSEKQQEQANSGASEGVSGHARRFG